MEKEIAVVTGGTRGIGYAISKKLLDEKYFVIALSTNNEQNEKWIASQNKNGFVDIDTYVCDVSDFLQCQKTISAIKEKYGKIDVLINNAGIIRDGVFRKMEKSNWDEVINVNLNSLFNITRPVVDIMIENGYGRIINISSVNAQIGKFGQTNYTAAKAGMHGFTKSLALEMATKNITVNTVSPGYISTEMVARIPREKKEKIIAQIPIGRFGTPDEVARVVTFLAAKESGYITGANFSINGGLHE